MSINRNYKEELVRRCMSEEAKRARVADLSGAIDLLLDRLKKLKRERYGLLVSLRMKEKHRTDSEYTKRFRAGRTKIAAISQARFNARKLPEMTADQKVVYEKLRRDTSREEALRWVMT